MEVLCKPEVHAMNQRRKPRGEEEEGEKKECRRKGKTWA